MAFLWKPITESNFNHELCIYRSLIRIKGRIRDANRPLIRNTQEDRRDLELASKKHCILIEMCCKITFLGRV